MRNSIKILSNLKITSEKNDKSVDMIFELEDFGYEAKLNDE